MSQDEALMEEAKQVFIQESEELLQEMEDALLLMEESPDDEENLNSVFRAMHTIKGSAGIFGFDFIVAFTHPIETELDKIRSGERSIDSNLTAILLDCKDHTATLVAQVAEAGDAILSDELKTQGDDLLSRLIDELPGLSVDDSSSSELTPTTDSQNEGSAEAMPHDNWLISLKFKQNALRNGLDPLSFIRYLETLGKIIDIITLLHSLQDMTAMDPENCYLEFRIAFNSDADKAAIENVFEFVQDDCDIRILPPYSKQQHYLELLNELPETELQQLGDLLIQVGALTRTELIAGLSDQETDDAGKDGVKHKPIGEILVDRQVVDKSVVSEALKKQEKTRAKVTQEARNIRVDSAKLGQLINLVGELVISGAAMKLMVERHGLSDVEEVVSTVEHLVEQIRDNALQLRMVQIGDTFPAFAVSCVMSVKKWKRRLSCVLLAVRVSWTKPLWKRSTIHSHILYETLWITVSRGQQCV